jgi:hypothetical protein
MTEPENHTLHLLREIREDIQKVDRKVDALDRKVDALDRKVDRNHDDLKERIGGLTRTLAGEMVDRSNAAAGVESRLVDFERRLAALEQDR